MGSTQVVATSDTARRLSGDPPFAGIGQVTNQDTRTPAMLYSSADGDTAPPEVATVWLGQARLYPDAANQTQLQNVNGGTNPGSFFVSALPFPVATGVTVAAQGYACDVDNTTCGWVAADFVQPAPRSAVDVAFLDTTWLAELNVAADLAWEAAQVLDPAAVRVAPIIYITGGTLYELGVVNAMAKTASLLNLGTAAAIISLVYS